MAKLQGPISVGSAGAIPATNTLTPSNLTASPPPQVSPLIQYGGPYSTAAAAVIAASIAGAIALKSINAARDNLITQMNAQREIAAKASRASVISANRQKWIDGVREDLAEFIAADFVLLDDVEIDEGVMSEAAKIRHHDRVEDAKRTRRLMQRRIQLRLNPDKESHKALYKAVTDLMPATGKDHRLARVRLVKIAQAFLRQEWLRVKAEAGEWDRINTSGPNPT